MVAIVRHVTPSRNVTRSHEKLVVLKRELRARYSIERREHQKDKEANEKEDEEEEYVGEDNGEEKRRKGEEIQKVRES
jgi:hypothetical protein